MSLRVALVYAGSEADRLRSTLSAVGHEVAHVPEADELAPLIGGHDHPDVCLLDASMPGVEDAWRALRLAQRHVFTIVMVPLMRAGPIKAAYDAGADDIMLASASGPEVCGRVDALQRIRRWLRSMGEDFADKTQRFSLRDVAAWNEPDTIVAKDLGAILDSRLTVRPVNYVPQFAVAATVTITAAGQDVEATVGIGVTAGSLCAVVQKIAPGEAARSDLAHDLIREFANTAAGAIQRASLQDGFTFALGLPTNFVGEQAKDGRFWRMCFNAADVYLWVHSNETISCRVTAGSLSEGMVLASEVRSPGGGLLLKAGAVMTERTVERLCRLVGPNTLVEVVKAA